MLPTRLKTDPRLQVVRDLKYAITTARSLRGSQARECTVCGYEGRFSARGVPPRLDAQCRGCGCLERHRLLALVIKREGLLPAGLRILHFAPEPIIASLFKDSRPSEYVSADLDPKLADIVLNIEQINQPDGEYDLALVSHVLEHVDDARAMSEIYRVLKPGGRMIAMVPIVEGWDATHEDPNVQSPSERVIEFGQRDHVRYYGRDFRRRLTDAGFAVEEFTGSPSECRRFALLRGERVFVCSKPSD